MVYECGLIITIYGDIRCHEYAIRITQNCYLQDVCYFLTMSTITQSVCLKMEMSITNYFIKIYLLSVAHQIKYKYNKFYLTYKFNFKNYGAFYIAW